MDNWEKRIEGEENPQNVQELAASGTSGSWGKGQLKQRGLLERQFLEVIITD